MFQKTPPSEKTKKRASGLGGPLKKRGRFVRQPHDERKLSQRNKDDKNGKAKENVLNVEIQTISSGSVQNYQETTIKEPSSEDHGVIETETMKKRPKTKNVFWTY
ncbi:hypothetical protein Tco_1407288 [Tanacetum coccineum]